jgi:hypothetical protein
MEKPEAVQLDERETRQRTVEACAWLIPIAEASVREFGWDPSIITWLDRIGSGCHAELQAMLRQ